MEQVTETELAQRAVAPRISQENVLAAIKAVDFHVFPATMLTVCCITMQNGFTVMGESACAAPENFQKDIGERISKENAIRKIWPLLGYMLRDRLYHEEGMKNA